MEATEQIVKRWTNRIRRSKIKTPQPDQYVDICYWSKTGWGIHNADGSCTCEPAKRPWGSRRR